MKKNNKKYNKKFDYKYAIKSNDNTNDDKAHTETKRKKRNEFVQLAIFLISGLPACIYTLHNGVETIIRSDIDYIFNGSKLLVAIRIIAAIYSYLWLQLLIITRDNT